MKCIIPNSKITLQVQLEGEVVTVREGEIQLPKKTWVLGEDYVWTAPADILEASGYLADLDGTLVLLVDEVRAGEEPFDPFAAGARPLWLVFRARRTEGVLTIVLHEPTEPPKPQPPEQPEEPNG